MKRTITIPLSTDASAAPVAGAASGAPVAAAAEDGEADRSFVTALARGMELMRAFGPDDDYLGNAELSRRTGLPRPTVSRLSYTLARLGYLVYAPEREKYRLGQGVLVLGHRYIAGSRLRDIARPLMQSLSFATDCTVALAMPDRHEMIYLEACQPRGALVKRLTPGSRLPMATSAIGRAWLAGLPPARRQPVLATLERHYGPRWPGVRSRLERALRDYARHGFCLAHAEWERSVAGAAAPVRLQGGAEVLAINIGGAAERLPPEILEANLGPRVRALADAIQHRLWQGGNSTEERLP